MNIHTLEKEKHYDFLQQERIDPITGDILQEGDQIVICASCKSAFLVDSWGYMDYKHCNQTHTLREIPKQEAVKIDRESRNERLNNLAFYQFRTVKESEAVNIFTGFFALIGGIISYGMYVSNNFEFLLIGLSIIFSGWLWGKKKYKQKSLVLNSGYFIVNQNQRNEIKIEAKNIESIKVEKARFFSRLANSFLFKKHEDFYDLIITTKTGTIHKLFISEYEVRRIQQETNILEKYSNSNYTQISPQNIPFITPPNDRLDLGS